MRLAATASPTILSMIHKAAVLGLMLVLTLGAWPALGAGAREDLECLVRAYPDFLASVQGDTAVVSRTGEVFPYDENLGERTYHELLDRADLRAQMSQPYPTQALTEPPAVNADPGRLRSNRFFRQLYGATEAEVRRNVQAVYWAPCNCYLAFNGKNGAAAALRAVGEEVARTPSLARYVSKPLGSFNWRKVAGSGRMSVHASAAAIDFNLPDSLGRYWRWDGCRQDAVCKYPTAVLEREELKEIVRIFESQGFIWGGKWYHYDAMHFEFRPEIVGPRCKG